MPFRDRLRDGQSRLTMHLATIPSAVVTQALAAAGADSVMIDLEHGAVDHASAHAMIAATAGTACAPLVRIAKLDDAHVKRALDLGAEGLVFPMVRDAADTEWAVRSLRYPPDGHRAFGPFLAHSRYGLDIAGYAKAFPERAVCAILAETLEAVENIEEICAVPGVDLVVPAPFDLSSAMGIPGQFEHPDFLAVLARMERAILASGIAMGSVAMDGERAAALFARGYRVVAGVDVLWLKQRAAEAQGWCAAAEHPAK